MLGTPLVIKILKKGESEAILQPEQMAFLQNLPIETAVVIEDGTNKGRPTITFLIQLPDGKYIAAETTGRLLHALAKVVKQFDTTLY